MKHWIISIVISIFIIEIILVVPWKFSPNLFILHGGNSVPIFREQAVGQTFINEYTLSGLRLKFKATNDVDHDFTVLLGDSGQALNNSYFVYKAQFKTRQLKTSSWQDFVHTTIN